MSVELFDEVDRNDQPTGKKVTKQEAHAQKLIHRCIAVYVFDANGELFVQEHKKSGGKLDHTVGGHVSSGESYHEAALREMEEEIRLTGVSLQEIATSVYSDERSYIHMFGIYECAAPQEWQFSPTEEVDNIYLMKLEVIVEDMNSNPGKYTGGFINSMKKYLEVKGVDLAVKVTL